MGITFKPFFIVGITAFVFSGCHSMGPLRRQLLDRQTYVEVEVTSFPANAHVLVNKYSKKNERRAEFLGLTPLFRSHLLRNSGETITISKEGYKTWRGHLALNSTLLHVDLEPLSPRILRKAQWNPISPVKRIGILPLGSDLRISGQSSAASIRAFNMHHITELTTQLAKELSKRSSVELHFSDYPAIKPAVWKKLHLGLRPYRADKVGYYSIPPRLSLPEKISTKMNPQDQYTLLIWYEFGADKHSIEQTQVAQRAAKKTVEFVGMLVAGGLLGVDANNFSASEQPNKVIRAKDAPYHSVNKNFLKAYMLLVESRTKRLVWYNTTYMPIPVHSETYNARFSRLLANTLPNRIIKK